MELSKINELMTRHGFGLRSWDDRYSKGVWVCIASNSYLLEEVEDASDYGSIEGKFNTLSNDFSKVWE